MRVGEQVPQRRDGAPGPGQVLLQTRQVRGDELVAGSQIRGREDRADLLQGHVEVTEPADDLRDPDLLRGIEPVARVRIDLRGTQQANVVVVPQRRHAQHCHAGKIADRYPSRHDHTFLSRIFLSP